MGGGGWGGFPGGPPPYFLTKLSSEGRKKFFWRPSPSLSQGLDDRGPSLSEGVWNRCCFKRKHSTCSRHSNIDIGAIGQSSPGIFMKNIKAREFIISIKTEILFKINLMFRKLYIYRLLAGVAVETLLANETLLVEMLLSKRERSVESPLGEQKDRSRIPITLSISCSSPTWLNENGNDFYAG